MRERKHSGQPGRGECMKERNSNLECGEHPIKWCTSFKYLGYWIRPKIGWSLMIRKSVLKIRQRMDIINGCRIFGATSIEFRRILFSSYVIPIFTWLFAIFPLFSDCQRQYLSHFYYTCLKRVTHNQQCEDLLFAFLAKEISLDNRCTARGTVSSKYSQKRMVKWQK